MSNEQVNKVDLSLDEIIKLNKKQRQQRSRGGSSMSQGKAGGRGQGVGGRRNSRGRRGGSGISPLKRKQTGTGSNPGGSRGQPAGRRGQRGNLRGWAGSRGGLRRGGSIGSRGGSRGGSSASSISSSLNANTRGSRGRGNQRENLDPALELANHAGFDPVDIASKLSKVLDTFRLRQLRSESRNLAARKVVLDRRYNRERLLCESDDLVVIYDCKRQVMIDWFIRKDRKRRLTHFEEDALNCVMMWSPVCSEKYKAACDMLSRKVAILASAIRHLYGARGSLRGVLRGRGSALLQGKARGGGGFQVGPGQAAAKRVSVKQKRQMAIQALQQARKTIAQLDQQSARQNLVNLRRGIVQQNQLLATNKKTGLYSSSVSLSSASSQVSVGSGRQLQGTKITAFSPPSSPQSTRGRRRWRPKSQAASQPISTSTLTISIDNPAPLSTDFSVPQVSVPAPRQRQRRRLWRRQSSDSSFDELDMNRGATPNFSSQLAKLKPTVSTKYVFQKKAFSTANTPVSLNDRFSGSGSEDLIGRKVFM